MCKREKEWERERKRERMSRVSSCSYLENILVFLFSRLYSILQGHELFPTSFLLVSCKLITLEEVTSPLHIFFLSIKREWESKVCQKTFDVHPVKRLFYSFNKSLWGKSPPRFFAHVLYYPDTLFSKRGHVWSYESMAVSEVELDLENRLKIMWHWASASY